MITHVGIVVDQIEPAMASIGAALGLTWCVVESRDLRVWTPEGEQTVAMRLTYSREGPAHVELLERAPGTVWDRPSDGSSQGFHHVGRWSDDVEADAARLESCGLTRAVAGLDSKGRLLFTYHRRTEGGFVELVSRRMEPAFARWIAGGRFA